jgi:hypothetical protein
VLTVLGWVLTLRGQGPKAVECWSRRRAWLKGSTSSARSRPWLHLLLRARVAHGELERRRRRARRWRASREAGALAMLSSVQLIAADVAFASATGKQPTI